MNDSRDMNISGQTCSTCGDTFSRGWVIGAVASCHRCAAAAVNPPRPTALEKRAARNWRVGSRCRVSA